MAATMRGGACSFGQWCAGPRDARRASMRPTMITHASAWESTMASTRMAARGARDGVGTVSAQSRRGQEWHYDNNIIVVHVFHTAISCIHFRVSIRTCHLYSICKCTSNLIVFGVLSLKYVFKIVR